MVNLSPTDHSIHRLPIWAFYSLFNALAIYFNTNLIISLYKLKQLKTSTDVLIGGGLSGGIIISALGCGPFVLCH